MTDTSYQYVRDAEAPKLPPPGRSTGVIHWLRSNLFSSVSNTILTIVTVLFLSWLLPLLYNFLIGRAVFTGTMDDCRVETFGACWVFITGRASFMFYGFYPMTEYWRPNTVFILGLLLVIPLGQEDPTTGGEGVGGFGDRPNVEALARVLFSDYVFAFEITSLLLTIAVVGAVVLAKRSSAS